MKNFIAGLFTFILLIIFPMQTALEIVNEARVAKLSNIIYASIQQARIDGYLNEDKLEEDIKKAFPDLKKEDIIIDLPEDKDRIKYRGSSFDTTDRIEYDISIRVGKIIAAPTLFGISADQNNYWLRRNGFVLSEVLPPLGLEE
jgi:hypothetical protein